MKESVTLDNDPVMINLDNALNKAIVLGNAPHYALIISNKGASPLFLPENS